MVNETVPKDILDKLNIGIGISATDLDIRDLTSASDSVEAKQGTAANLKAEVVNPAGTGIQVLSYGSSDGGTTWYPMAVDTDGHLQADVLGDFLPVPVGTVLPWLKTYANTPALPDEFVECNGQVLDDAASVYDGQTIPNLNGNNNFLRGAATSGGTGGASTNNLAHVHTQPTHTHSVSDSGNTGYENSHTHYFTSYQSSYGSTVDYVQGGTNEGIPGDLHTHVVEGRTDAGTSHRHSFSMSDTSSANGSENTGGALSSTQENKPPYYNVVWIMRVK